MDVSELYIMLENRRRELNLSQEEVEQRAFGKRGNSALQRIRRGSAPSYDRLVSLGKALNLEFYFGPSRAMPIASEAVSEDYIRIPRYDALLSAGAGAMNHDNLPSSSLAFRLNWLAKKGINPSECVIVSVSGDSMEPTLFEGDLVMIDRQATVIREMRLFAIVDTDGTARVKRLSKTDDQLLLHSDNRDYPTEVRSSSDTDIMSVIGQVVWSGHEFER